MVPVPSKGQSLPWLQDEEGWFPSPGSWRKGTLAITQPSFADSSPVCPGCGLPWLWGLDLTVLIKISCSAGNLSALAHGMRLFSAGTAVLVGTRPGEPGAAAAPAASLHGEGQHQHPGDIKWAISWGWWKRLREELACRMEHRSYLLCPTPPACHALPPYGFCPLQELSDSFTAITKWRF